MKKKKILGAKENTCKSCGGNMYHLFIQNFGIVSNCIECGAVVRGKEKEEVKIYEFDEAGNLI